jgi:ABC transporter substrate binding protein
VPVVFVSVSDPVAQGFVASMKQPGGNTTGFSLYEFSIGSKWLDLLKEVVPGLARVAGPPRKTVGTAEVVALLKEVRPVGHFAEREASGFGNLVSTRGVPRAANAASNGVTGLGLRCMSDNHISLQCATYAFGRCRQHLASILGDAEMRSLGQLHQPSLT